MATLLKAAPSSELYTLRWETEHLLAFGAALQSVSVTALAKGWAIGQIKTLLIGSLLAAVAWPLWLVKASKIIDNAYSVIMVSSRNGPTLHTTPQPPSAFHTDNHLTPPSLWITLVP